MYVGPCFPRTFQSIWFLHGLIVRCGYIGACRGPIALGLRSCGIPELQILYTSGSWPNSYPSERGICSTVQQTFAEMFQYLYGDCFPQPRRSSRLRRMASDLRLARTLGCGSRPCSTIQTVELCQDQQYGVLLRTIVAHAEIWR